MSKKRLAGTYTGVFVLLAFAIFGLTIITGHSLIYRYDSWFQHSKAFAYLGIWLRDVLFSAGSNPGALPTFSLSLGYGSDILTTLHYYGIGDPLNLISVAVPPEYSGLAYSILIVLRFYLVGLSFALSARYILGRADLGTLVASLCYAFSGWMLYEVLMHPFFSLPMIIFPMAIAGVERIIRERKLGLLIGAIALIGISSFYFFYMICLIGLLYIAVRLVFIGREQGKSKAFAILGRVVSAAIAGVGLAAIILIPMLFAFFASSRNSSGNALSIVYPWHYYLELIPRLFFSATHDDSAVFIEAGPWSLIAILWLLTARHRRRMMRLFAGMGIFALLIPIVGSILNGGSYPTGRWTWALVFALALAVAFSWHDLWNAGADELHKLKKRYIIVGVAAIVCAGVLAVFSPTPNYILYGGVTVAFALGFIIVNQLSAAACGKKTFVSAQKTAFATTLVLFIVIGWAHVIGEGSRFVPRDMWAAAYTHDSVAAALAEYSDEDYMRYEITPTSSLSDNQSLLHGISSTQFYWSIDQKRTEDFRQELGISEGVSYARNGLAQRTLLGLPVGIKYTAVPEGQPVADGSQAIGDVWDAKSQNTMILYRRELVAPFGTTYSKLLDNNAWDVMSPSEREEALLYGALIDGKTSIVTERSEPSLHAYPLDYRIVSDPSNSFEQGRLVVEDQGQKLRIEFDEPQSGEIHLEFSGLEIVGYRDSTPTATAVIETQCHAGDAAAHAWIPRTTYRWGTPPERMILNAGSCPQGTSYVELSFIQPANLSFDAFQVWNQPLEGVEEAVANLAYEPLENVDFHDIGLSRATSEITGEVTVSEPKLLVLAILKTDGWKAYVDGKEQEILTANVMFMGLELEPGHHDIRLVYHTPGLRLGFAISIGTLVGICAVWLFRRKRMKNKSETLERT